jgi:hypothetical protein
VPFFSSKYFGLASGALFTPPTLTAKAHLASKDILCQVMSSLDFFLVLVLGGKVAT